MSGDAGGWLWLAIDVGFVVVLAAALIYGLVTWRNRRGNTRDQVAPELRQRADRR
jgi:hypothetical protein